MPRNAASQKLTAVSNLLIEGYKNGMTFRELATLHGVAPGSVRTHLVTKGVPIRSKGRRKKNVEPQVASQGDVHGV